MLYFSSERRPTPYGLYESKRNRFAVTRDVFGFNCSAQNEGVEQDVQTHLEKKWGIGERVEKACLSHSPKKLR